MQAEHRFDPPLADVADVPGDRLTLAGDALILQIDFKRSLSVWWSLVWRATLAGAVAGFLLGAIAGVSAALLRHPELSGVAGSWAGMLVSIPVSMWALFAALRKKHAGFTIAFVRSR